jgi:hypothetical protein
MEPSSDGLHCPTRARKASIRIGPRGHKREIKAGARTGRRGVRVSAKPAPAADPQWRGDGNRPRRAGARVASLYGMLILCTPIPNGLLRPARRITSLAMAIRDWSEFPVAKPVGRDRLTVSGARQAAVYA